jgi:hAT family C-terminal dimerisation region
VLDPSQKTAHFKKYWTPQSERQALVAAEEIVRLFCLGSAFVDAAFMQYKERHFEMYGSTSLPPAKKKHDSKIRSLLRELSDDEDDKFSESPADPVDPNQPWLAGFRVYLDTCDDLQGLSIVGWWGVCALFRLPFLISHQLRSLFQMNAHWYPVWASLAADYLSIMASSVSSERAFSSAGITISRRRNRLKPDIVEAPQCLKCLFRHDLIFREFASTVCTEGLDPEAEEQNEGDQESRVPDDDHSWDDLLDDDPDNEDSGLDTDVDE